jgi:hypothetical protein
MTVFHHILQDAATKIKPTLHWFLEVRAGDLFVCFLDDRGNSHAVFSVGEDGTYSLRSGLPRDCGLQVAEHNTIKRAGT